MFSVCSILPTLVNKRIHMANFGQLAAEIGSGVWGTSANFNVFHVLASLVERCHSPEANQTWCLAVSWAGTLYKIVGGFCPPDGISPREKFTLRPSLAFSYIGSLTAQHSSSGVSQTLRRGTITELSQRTPHIFGWAAITLGIGPHSTLCLKKVPTF